VTLQVETVSDLDAVWEDLVRLYLAFDAYNQPLQPHKLASDWQDRLRGRLKLHEDRLILIARSEGEAVGQLVAVIRRNEGLAGEDFGYLSHVFVEEGHRGGGAGAAMLSQAEDWCGLRGVSRIELEVLEGNELGRRFWTNSGFEAYSLTMQKFSRSERDEKR
jgi:GNAT superfamily N-acetyltransferase